MSFDDELRAALADEAGRASPHAPPALEWSKIRSRRIATTLTAGALTTVIVAALTFAFAAIRGSDLNPAPPTRAPAAVNPFADVKKGWTRLASPPQAVWGAAAVWTGQELIYWGGEVPNTGRINTAGWSFDATNERWDPLPESPIRSSDPAVVWTGREMILWGGYDPVTKEPIADGAAYDAQRHEWRTIAAAPLSGHAPAVAAWTGNEVIIWGDGSPFSTSVDGARYDPERNTWEEIAPAPVALNEAIAIFKGQELFVVGAHLDENNHAETQHPVAMAYSPANDVWRRLPDVPLSPQAFAVAPLERGILVWDYLGQAALYDLQAESWQDIADPPFSRSECQPLATNIGESVFALFCNRAAVFDAEKERWIDVDLPREHVIGELTPAGTALLLPGTTGSKTRPSLWVFRR